MDMAISIEYNWNYMEKYTKIQYNRLGRKLGFKRSWC